MEILLIAYAIIAVITAVVHVNLVAQVGHGWSYVGPFNFILSGLLWPYTIFAWVYYFVTKG